VVTLDRVVCCYPDAEALLSAAATRARRLVGLVYPRDRWWVRTFISIKNLVDRLRSDPFRAFIHPSSLVDGTLRRAGFVPVADARTPIWQVWVYRRAAGVGGATD
jgi:magnesium-protoporphyrin O-methyltransferase